MKNHILPAFCVLAAALMVSCGSSDRPASEAAEPEEGVFDPMVDTLDRAKRVEQFSKDRKQQLDQQLQESEEKPPRNENR